jgi:CheY-like chemotaxis protein
MKILVAEDNDINQLVMLSMFERMGYRAEVVENGAQAVEALRKNTYDVVFMDLQMPVMDGIEATKQIRIEHGPKRPIIIAVTADAFPEDRARCLNAGMNDYLAKPITTKTLSAILERWIVLK